MNKLIVTLFLLVLSTTSFAKEKGQVTGLPTPRFVAVKSNEINLRKGPNVSYPIRWVYKRKEHPMEVIAEFDNWRKLRDFDGADGWVHETLISGKRTVVIINNDYFGNKPKYAKRNKELILFRHPDEKSHPMLRIEFGAIGKIKQCSKEWCKLQFAKDSGWARKKNLWGIYREEIIG